MEGRDSMSAGVTVIGAEAPSNYHIASRTENLTTVAVAPPMVASPMTLGVVVTTEKKKRGRPRKYGPDGAISSALSPMPISSSTLSPFNGSQSSGDKRGRGRPIGSVNKQRYKVGQGNSGELVACSAGSNFMPHLITVNKGEDITMKIISFTKQGPRAICIISAVGLISNATLQQPDSSGGTLTYEGIFEILSLSGSFAPTEVDGSGVSRSGGLSVALVSPDGRVIGGMLAGLLIAGGPVQVVVGSFLPDGHQELKPKKHKLDSNIAPNAPNSAALDNKGYIAQEQNYSAAPKPNLSSFPIQTENWASMETTPNSRKSTTDINITLHGE